MHEFKIMYAHINSLHRAFNGKRDEVYIQINNKNIHDTRTKNRMLILFLPLTNTVNVNLENDNNITCV